MPSTIDMFVAAFGRGPSPQESTWLVRWDHSLQAGSMTMKDVADIMGISPEVKVNETLSQTAPASASDTATDNSTPTPPPEQVDQVATLIEALETVYGRPADIPTLHAMLRRLETGDADIAQLLVEQAFSDGANPNDLALLSAQSDSAIEYLKTAGWNGYRQDASAQSVITVTRDSVADPSAEPLAETLFTQARWDTFTQVRDQLDAYDEVRIENTSIDTMHLLSPLHSEGGLTFTLSEPLSTLAQAPEWMINEAESYQLTNDPQALANTSVANALSAQEVALLDGAANRDALTYRIADDLATLVKAHAAPVAEDQTPALELADALVLTDAAEAFAALPLSAALNDAELAMLNRVDNREAYTYRITDTLAALENALSEGEALDTSVLDAADAYTLSNPADAFTDVAVDSLSVNALALLNNAANREDYTYTVSDSLANLQSAPEHVTTNMAGYRLTNDPADFSHLAIDEALTADMLALIAGADNAEAYTMTLRDTAENLLNGDQAARDNADSITLSDAASAFEGMSVDAITSDFLALLEQTTNGSNYTVTLSDTMENILAASDEVLARASAFSLTDDAPAEITPTEHARLLAHFEVAADNAGEYGVRGSAREITEALTLNPDNADDALLDYSMLASITHDDTNGNVATGTHGVLDTFVVARNGEARIDGFEVGDAHHDRLDVADFLPVEWGTPSDIVRFDFVSSTTTLPFATPEEAGEVIGINEALLPAEAPSEAEAVAQAFDGIVIAPSDGAVFETIVNRKLLAVAEDNVDGGVTTFWLWEEDDSSDDFDGQVQDSELTRLVTLVGVSNDDLASLTHDYFI